MADGSEDCSEEGRVKSAQGGVRLRAAPCDVPSRYVSVAVLAFLPLYSI
jgi:hypothetical protein